MRPTVDSNGGDVAGRIETAAGEGAAELLADVSLEGLEWRG
jgi:hypothetical protein